MNVEPWLWVIGIFAIAALVGGGGAAYNRRRGCGCPVDLEDHDEPPKKVIKFYRRGDAYGEWTNFAPYAINDGTKVWPTSEHKFQADKFEGTDPAYQEQIRSNPDPKVAAALGRDRSRPLRADWNSPATITDPDDADLPSNWQRFVGDEPMLVKDYSMLNAVRMKVRQHVELQDKLLDTGDAILVEHTEKDNYWADGGDGSGKNMLGKILMLVRFEEARRRDTMGS
jgi:predicted NAD-dependent protein-ADP-ribosyltransferase YbiA (DUF1768 family)